MGVQQQAKAREITATSFDSDVLKSDKYVLVDFWAPWCMPCLVMAPVLDEVAEMFKDRLEVTKINVDLPENQELSYKYNIRSIPNMKLFKDGKLVTEFIGARPREMFIQELKNFVE